MRKPKGISSEAAGSCSGSGAEEVSTSRSHSRAIRVQPASCIFERYVEVGRMLTRSRIRSIFFTEASWMGAVLDAGDAIFRSRMWQSSCRGRNQRKLQNQRDFRRKAEAWPACKRPV